LLDHPRRLSTNFWANDEMAMGCMHEIRRAGLQTPADMSIVGFDDTRYAEIVPHRLVIRQSVAPPRDSATQD